MTKDQMRSIEEALDFALKVLDSMRIVDFSMENLVCWNKAMNAIKQARALDKKADNARELGLDYEPVESGDTLFRQFMSEADKAGITHLPTPPAAQQDIQRLSALVRAQQITIDKLEAQPAPVQEPVGRVCFEGDEVVWTDEPPESGTLLYTTPPNVATPLRMENAELKATPPAAPVQEPLFWYKPYPNGMYNGPVHNAQIGDVLRGSEEWRPLYTTPPAAQRQWVGLTTDDVWGSNEVMALNAEMGLTIVQIMTLMAWANAKLKEKNT